MPPSDDMKAPEPLRRQLRTAAGLVLIGACLSGAAALFALQGCGRQGGGGDSSAEGPEAKHVPEKGTATYLGAARCAECHAEEHGLWQNSHHDLAMQPATEETVLGDFDDAEFAHFGIESKFFRRDGKFFAHTPGPDGVHQDYPIEYVFGVYPLQQYLIPFPGGRYQALQICWDSRPAEEGGQRWYHLYPDEPIPHDDVLHWTGDQFNWNYMCAECHSTNLHKNYDVAKDAYHTEWSEMDVSCEACHGPGSAHVEWAEMADPPGEGEKYTGDMGLTVRLKEPEEGSWYVDSESGQPKRSIPLQSNVQVEACAPCHAHRRVLAGEFRPGQPLLDTHVPSLLTEVLYHPDGQIKEEVYVYGSFTQSKMFHHGVRCVDCHNPHSLKLMAPGNALCVRCHQPDKYDTPSHHFHPPDSEGASCVDCHMPVKHYMVVDARRDHSLRIPRPDLSVKLGTPNACTNCHVDQPVAWAADAFAEWYGKKEREPRYGEVLAAGRAGAPGSEARLADLFANPEYPAIVRATALSELGARPTQASLRTIVTGLGDVDPLVRETALQGLEVLQPAQRLQFAARLLEDPVMAVRVQAVRQLAAAVGSMTEAQRAAFDAAKEEYIAAQAVVADRPGAHVALGLLYTDLGESGKAEDAYRDAIRIAPADLAARVNLSELLYQLGRMDEGRPLLEEAVRLNPDNGVAHEVLGRYWIRRKDYARGTESIGRAAALMPEHAQIQYFYGVALNQMERFEEALPFLEKAYRLEPGNAEYLVGLATICRDRGRRGLAKRYAAELVEKFPEVPGYRQLLEDLR